MSTHEIPWLLAIAQGPSESVRHRDGVWPERRRADLLPVGPGTSARPEMDLHRNAGRLAVREGGHTCGCELSLDHNADLAYRSVRAGEELPEDA